MCGASARRLRSKNTRVGVGASRALYIPGPCVTRGRQTLIDQASADIGGRAPHYVSVVCCGAAAERGRNRRFADGTGGHTLTRGGC